MKVLKAIIFTALFCIIFSVSVKAQTYYSSDMAKDVNGMILYPNDVIVNDSNENSSFTMYFHKIEITEEGSFGTIIGSVKIPNNKSTTVGKWENASSWTNQDDVYLIKNFRSTVWYVHGCGYKPNYCFQLDVRSHGNKMCKIKYYSNGDLYTDSNIYYFDIPLKPTDPVREGFEFDGWFTEPTFETRYLFNQEVTSDISLYAKWNKTTEIETKEQEVKEPEKETQEVKEPEEETTEVKSELPYGTVMCGNGGKGNGGKDAVGIKVLKPEQRDTDNQIMFANAYFNKNVTKVFSYNVYPPYGVNASYKNAVKTLYWKDTGLKQGDEVYAIWYCQSSKKGVQVIKCDIDENGVVSIRIPQLGETSVITLVKVN